PSAGDLEAALPIARDPEEADGRWLALAAERERVLPPVALEPGQTAFLLDRLPELLVDGPHVGRREGLRVPHGRHAEQIGGQLGALRVQDERAAHAQRAAEQASFEHHVVARGRLARRGWVLWTAGPGVLREDERREIALSRELHEPVERRHAGVEDRGPRLDLSDVRQPTRLRPDELRLLPRRTEEDAGLHAAKSTAGGCAGP